jgi:hypothetical protein
MPPDGAASPAPNTIRTPSADARNTPPGTARPSTTAAKATSPRLLITGGPKAANAPPAGAPSPWATIFCSRPARAR